MPCWGGHAVAQSSAYHCELDCTVKCDQYVLEMFFDQATDRVVELTKYHIPKDLHPAPKTAPNVITVLRKGSNRRTSYHCRDCSRDFVEEKDLLHHLATARQHQEWFCCPCDAYFTTREAYDLHMTKSPAHFLPLPMAPTPSHHPSSKTWNRSQTPLRKSLDVWFLRERSHNQSSGSWGQGQGWARPEPARDQSRARTPEPPGRASNWRAQAVTPDTTKQRTPVAAERGNGIVAVDDSAAEDWGDWGDLGSKKGGSSSWLPWGSSKSVGRTKWQGPYEQMVQPRV